MGQGTWMIVNQNSNKQSLSRQFDCNIFGTAELKLPERLDSGRGSKPQYKKLASSIPTRCDS
jgi:hypothetical protein